MTGPAQKQVGGIPLRDYPRLLVVRLTACRKHGHSFGINENYCQDCGWPWFFRVERRRDLV